MKCPNCKEPIEVDLEIEKWSIDHSKSIPIGEPAMLQCICPKCKNGGVWVEMIPYTENLL